MLLRRVEEVADFPEALAESITKRWFSVCIWKEK